MYIANVTATNEWQSVEELVSTATGETFSFSSGSTYHITNDSDYNAFLVNQDTAPTEKTGVGMVLPPHTQASFKTGTSTKLYCIVNTEPVNLCVELEG